MGFWSTLGKVALGVGGVAAAPFTGGASLIPTILGTAGQVAGALGGGRAQGRVAEAVLQQAQDRNAIAAANTNLRAGSDRASQAVRGDILARAQPFRYTGGTQMVGNIPVPISEGGLSPALFSEATRALGAKLAQDALSAQTADHGQAVRLTPLPQRTALDSILNTVGTVGGFADALKAYQRPAPRRITDLGALDPSQLPGYRSV